MDQTISLRYMRTVQQLEKKTEEVDQLLRDAKSLDGENINLRRQNEELIRRLEMVQQNDRQREEEVALLEGHVRKQQQKLQRYIDQEVQQQRQPLQLPQAPTPSPLVAAPSEPKIVYLTQDKPSASPPPKRVTKAQQVTPTLSPIPRTATPPAMTHASTADLVEAQRQLLESETSRVSTKKDLEAALSDAGRIKNDFAMLQRTVADLKHQLGVREEAIRAAVRREDGMKSTLRQLNHRHMAVALESKEMEDIEAKALEGLKAELMLLEAENDRAQGALQEERQRYRDAKGEFDKASALLSKQKTLFEAHQKISAEEIQALTQQLESMLADMKASSDRAQRQGAEILRLNAQVSQLTSRPVASPSTPLAIAPPPVAQQQKVTETATFVDPEQPALVKGINDNESSNAQTIQELLARLDAVHKEKEEALLIAADASRQVADRQRRIDELDREAEAMRLRYEALRNFTNEREATDKLRKEKEAFQAEEIRRLHGELAVTAEGVAAQRIAYKDGLSSVTVKRSELEALRDIAATCLISATATYRVVAAATSSRDAVPPEDSFSDAAPPLSDPTLRCAYNDIIGAQLTLQYIKSAAKGMLGAEVRQSVKQSQPLVRNGTLAINSHSLHDAIAPRQRSHYSEGPSLKDVIDEYRKTSPRRAAHLDTSNLVSARDPLQLAQWELRRLHLLEERNGSIKM